MDHQPDDIHGGPRTLTREEYTGLLGELQAAFPDLTIEPILQVAEGDYVVTRVQASGTQEGSFMGAAATGRALSWIGVDTIRVEDGKIVEIWVDWDKYGVCEQLGLVPSR